ncbi:Uncharacterised protein [Mycobacteroides abscessus subsp. massiliense]|nr:Uncharacterised protein [Mycobacteroides abscessus subsp. massiliense]
MVDDDVVADELDQQVPHDRGVCELNADQQPSTAYLYLIGAEPLRACRADPVQKDLPELRGPLNQSLLGDHAQRSADRRHTQRAG